MAQLVVEHNGRRFAFDGSAAVRIGRSPESDVVCSSPAVSRSHVVVSLDAGRWTVEDEGSSLGTFVGNERIQRLAVDRPVTLQLGGEEEGEAVRLMVDDPFARKAPADFGTVLVPKDAVEGADAISVEWEGVRAVARSGEVLTIGRDASCGLTVDDPIVSRRHASIAQRGDRWVLQDTQSSRGIFLGGASVDQVDLRGRTAVHLGDPAGPAVIVTVGERKRRTVALDKRFTRIAAPAAVVLLLLFGGLWWFTRGGPDASGLDQAKQASVWLNVTYRGEDGVTTGSGTVVSEDGLILTSAHVVDRDAPGLAPTYGPDDPSGERPVVEAELDQIEVYRYVSDDRIELAYTASTVVADGYLDLAVLQIDGTKDGAEVDKEGLNLAHVDIGDSDSIGTGADLEVLGFPDEEQATSVSVQPETITSFSGQALIGSRAWMRGQASTVSPGSSGGPLVDADGRVVGVTTEVVEEDNGQRVLYRPAALARPLVDAATSGSSSQYGRYRYVKLRDPSGHFAVRGLGAARTCPSQADAQVVDRTKGVSYAYVDYENVRPGQAVYVSVSEGEGEEELAGSWRLFTDDKMADSGCLAWRIGLQPEVLAEKPDLATLEVKVAVGPSFEDLRPDDKPLPFFLVPGAK